MFLSFCRDVLQSKLTVTGHLQVIYRSMSKPCYITLQYVIECNTETYFSSDVTLLYDITTTLPTTNQPILLTNWNSLSVWKYLSISEVFLEILDISVKFGGFPGEFIKIYWNREKTPKNGSTGKSAPRNCCSTSILVWPRKLSAILLILPTLPRFSLLDDL